MMSVPILFKGSGDQYMPGVSSDLADESFGDGEPTLTPPIQVYNDAREGSRRPTNDPARSTGGGTIVLYA